MGIPTLGGRETSVICVEWGLKLWHIVKKRQPQEAGEHSTDGCWVLPEFQIPHGENQAGGTGEGGTCGGGEEAQKRLRRLRCVGLMSSSKDGTAT